MMVKKLLYPPKNMKINLLIKVEEQPHLTTELMKHGLRYAGKTVPQRMIWDFKCLIGILLHS